MARQRRSKRNRRRGAKRNVRPNRGGWPGGRAVGVLAIGMLMGFGWIGAHVFASPAIPARSLDTQATASDAREMAQQMLISRRKPSPRASRARAIRRELIGLRADLAGMEAGQPPDAARLRRATQRLASAYRMGPDRSGEGLIETQSAGAHSRMEALARTVEALGRRTDAASDVAGLIDEIDAALAAPTEDTGRIFYLTGIEEQ